MVTQLEGVNAKTWVALVTGSRSFKSNYKIHEALSSTAQQAHSLGARNLVVMHGANPSGLDAAAHQWASSRSEYWLPGLKIYEQADPAIWDGPSRLRAGPERNRRQAQRLWEYYQAGADVRIFVAHYMLSLDEVLELLKSGTAGQVRELIQVGFRQQDMTYLEEN